MIWWIIYVGTLYVFITFFYRLLCLFLWDILWDILYIYPYALLPEEDEETRILLEKEFDDYYEDQVHKSAGPLVFVSKMLGMLPAIWTDDDEENECKSYFNVYTFAIFAGKKPEEIYEPPFRDILII